MAQYFVRWEASEMCAEVCPDGIFADILAQACAHFGVDPSRAALRHDGVQLDGDDRLCAAPFTPGTCLDLARRLGDDETCQVLGPFRLVRRQRRHSDDSVSGTSYQFEVSGPPNFTNLLGGYSGEDLCTAWGETEVGYRAAVLCETPGAPDVIRLRLSPCKGGEPTFVALDPEPPADVPDRYPQPVSEAKAASEAKAKAAVLARAAAAASAPASSSSSSSSATQEEEEEEEEEGVHSRRSGPAEYFVRWGTAETRVEVDPSGVFADVLAQACAHFGVDPSRAALRHDGDEVVGAARLRTAQFGSGVLLDLALKKRQKKKKRNKEGQKREGEPAAAAAASSSDARRAPVASGPFPSSGARRASTQQKVGPFRLTSSETHTRCADAVVAAYQFKVRGPAGFSPKGYTGVSSSSAWGYDDTGYCAARLVQDASLPDGVRLELTCCGTGKVESVVLCVDGTPDTAATATTDELPSPPLPLPLSQLQLPPQESDAEDAPAAGGAAGAAAPSPLQALPRRLPPLDGGAAAAPVAASSPPATAVEAVAAAAALQGPSPPPQPAPVKQSPAAARTTESVGGSGGGGAENLRRWETCVAPARPGDALPTVRFRRRLQG